MNMNEQQAGNTGANLGKCFQVVAQAYKETEALIVALQGLMADIDVEWSNPDADWDEEPVQKKREGFFYNDYMCSSPLADGSFLGFQISLMGSGVNLGGNDEPLLHVFNWSYDEEDGKPTLYDGMGYPLAEPQPMLWGESLLAWPKDGVWTFSVRLASLTNKMDLEDRIITPIKQLLEMQELSQHAYEQTPIAAWDGLVRYNTNDQGELVSIKAASDK
jgi:hypothetical protein